MLKSVKYMKYKIYIASIHAGKKAAGEQAAREHHAAHYQDRLLEEIIVDARKYPEVVSGKRRRSISPVALSGYTLIEEACLLRVEQVSERLRNEGQSTSQPDVQRLIVAQESGMKVNNIREWRRKGVVNDLTIAAVRDLDNPQQPTVMAVSDGIRVRLRDFMQTILTNTLSHVTFGLVEPVTIGHVVQKRLAKKHIQVDHQDWYASYDASDERHRLICNESRAYYIAQASVRAVLKLPGPVS